MKFSVDRIIVLSYTIRVGSAEAFKTLTFDNDLIVLNKELNKSKKLCYNRARQMTWICWRSSTVEQLICNQQVGSSILFASSIQQYLYGGIPELAKGDGL